MTELQKLKNKIIDGEIDIYDVHGNPKNDLEKIISKEIEEVFNMSYHDHGLHADDDACEIYDLIINSWDYV